MGIVLGMCSFLFCMFGMYSFSVEVVKVFVVSGVILCFNFIDNLCINCSKGCLSGMIEFVECILIVDC